jgi:hypothetical protein
MNIKTQKKKAWTAFSAYIRTRDCVAYMTTRPELNEMQCACITCGRVYGYKKLQAGHFVSGRTNAVLFDERGVHSQCYGCNVGKSGDAVKYYPIMVERFGQEVVDELIQKRNETVKFTVDELRDMELDYKTRKEELQGIFLDKNGGD